MCGIQVVLLWKEEGNKGGRQTSNISQHQKGYSDFLCVVFTERRRGGSARGGCGQTRDNGHLSSVPGWPGGRTVGTRSGRSRWQGATRESPLSLCWLDRARLRAQVGGTPRPPGGASGTALTISQPHRRHSVLPSGSGFSWEVCVEG